jgi:hypothetical protein
MCQKKGLKGEKEKQTAGADYTQIGRLFLLQKHQKDSIFAT